MTYSLAKSEAISLPLSLYWTGRTANTGSLQVFLGSFNSLSFFLQQKHVLGIENIE